MNLEIKNKCKDFIESFEKTENVSIGMVKADTKKVFYNQVPFVGYTPQERANPALHLEDAASIVVILMPVYYDVEKPADMRGRGIFSMEAVGLDYHLLLREKLKKLSQGLGAITNIKQKIFVDTGPLIERELLVEAGLGIYLRNGQVTHERFGSFCHSGYMLSTMDFFPLDKKTLLINQCDSCQRCVAACPGNALKNGFNYHRCIAYITQKKGDVSLEEAKILGNHLYGCDICRLVCPHNVSARGMVMDDELMYPFLSDFLDISHGEFKEKYNHRAFSWRGKNILKRNAEIIQKNQENV